MVCCIYRCEGRAAHLNSEEHGTYLNTGVSISILLCNSRMIESGH